MTLLARSSSCHNFRSSALRTTDAITGQIVESVQRAPAGVLGTWQCLVITMRKIKSIDVNVTNHT